VLDCWDREFESCWGHGCSSLVFVVCCVGSDLCNKLITCSEGSSRFVCLIVCHLETWTIRWPQSELDYCGVGTGNIVMIIRIAIHSFIHLFMFMWSTIGTWWAIGYGTSQIMYQINLIHMSLKVRLQHAIITNMIFKVIIWYVSSSKTMAYSNCNHYL